MKENILVDKSGCPLISDFGISRIVNASQSYGVTTQSSGTKGTIRWMAIELFDLLANTQNHTVESDVWAFGMTIYVSVILHTCKH